MTNESLIRIFKASMFSIFTLFSVFHCTVVSYFLHFFLNTCVLRDACILVALTLFYVFTVFFIKIHVH